MPHGDSMVFVPRVCSAGIVIESGSIDSEPFRKPHNQLWGRRNVISPTHAWVAQ
jgi:hypothetical protein